MRLRQGDISIDISLVDGNGELISIDGFFEEREVAVGATETVPGLLVVRIFAYIVLQVFDSFLDTPRLKADIIVIIDGEFIARVALHSLAVIIQRVVVIPHFVVFLSHVGVDATQHPAVGSRLLKISDSFL